MQKIWRDKYSKISDIDQRLINPDTSNDQKYELDRQQVFGHAKSYWFLKTLRETLPTEAFDSAVRNLISKEKGNVISYDLFLNYLRPFDQGNVINEVESQFCIR